VVLSCGEIISAKIVKIVDENPSTKSFYLKPLKTINTPQPGQFFMVWIPNYEEIPLSVSGVFGDLLRITVAKRGKTTSYMHKLREGFFLGIKGPLGNHILIEKDKNYLFVSGGYGVAPLIFASRIAVEKGATPILLIGARSKDLLLFYNEATNLGIETYVSTDDGSLGFSGTVIDLAKYIIFRKRKKVDCIISCGPEPVLIESAKLARLLGIHSQILAEEYMKCGIGICGSCELGDSGLLVCRDGPVFDGEVYLKALKL